ncbi:NeuD/PglB/VioB family sugar acetyltransferase [Pseudobutyrivibrio xylanivorans]|uniref:Sugar O-acyltransferase, sialic acid O-acetyltransferase NeuD family n=1 Tax=Pseudobutyrivibrio xylanivorans DSM 14809 TaxID=1123012 RepID=A0A1M6I2G3_PSEXY|nr:NeuD/PglB/VioB family sugar acetyltransferase [Pseudobutyrivibrio xylanivorans]SHJ28648.1 sugar O-acyltransferase, sialic acid O-acetyltransferase NeuD family [Pseudobutyrivibrio xylanivorans DSM 14809]
MILGVFGAGGNGKTVVDAAQIFWGNTSRWEKIIFIDDVVGEKEVYQHEVFTYEEMKEKYSPDKIEILISLGEPSARKHAYDMIKHDGYRLGQLITPGSVLPQNYSFGEGVIILEADINSDVTVGDNTFISAEAMIGHDTIIGNDCIIGPRAFIAGHCNIGNQVYIGPNASLRDRINIEDTAVVSIGAVVFKNVTSDSIAIGNPSRSMKKTDDYQVFK